MNQIEKAPSTDLEHSPVADLVHSRASGAQWLSRYSSSLLGVFGTPQRVLVRGAGCLVWDADGKEYLDLLGGIAVNALAPEAAVMTENAATLVSLPELAVEPLEAFAEATLALCTCDPRTLTGRVLYSVSLLQELRRPVRTLDGRGLVPGWQPGEIDPVRMKPGYLDPH